MSTLERISEILKDYTTSNENLHQIVGKRIEYQEEIVLILPVSPLKNPNPEEVDLKNMQSLCERINETYSPGAYVAVCTDGLVLGDVMKVSDESVHNYNHRLKMIIQELNLTHLRVYSMEDFFPNQSFDQLRKLLIDVYALTLDEVKTLVSEKESFKNRFDGVHTPLNGDGEEFYELIRRSDGWSQLLDEHFKEALELSHRSYERQL